MNSSFSVSIPTVSSLQQSTTQVNLSIQPDALSELHREQRDAIGAIFRHLANSGPRPRLASPFDFEPIQGSFSFFPTDFRICNLPSPNFWSWNQSRGSAECEIDSGIDLRLIKLTARRKRAGDRNLPVPSYKIWKCLIRGIGPEPLVALWCERGEKVPFNPSTSPSFLDMLLDCESSLPSAPGLLEPSLPSAPGLLEPSLPSAPGLLESTATFIASQTWTEADFSLDSAPVGAGRDQNASFTSHESDQCSIQ